MYRLDLSKPNRLFVAYFFFFFFFFFFYYFLLFFCSSSSSLSCLFFLLPLLPLQQTSVVADGWSTKTVVAHTLLVLLSLFESSISTSGCYIPPCRALRWRATK